MAMIRFNTLRDFFHGRDSAYRKVFEGDGGKLVLADIANFAGVHKSIYTSNANDLAYRAGMVDLYRHIVHLAMGDGGGFDEGAPIVDVNELKRANNAR